MPDLSRGEEDGFHNSLLGIGGVNFSEGESALPTGSRSQGQELIGRSCCLARVTGDLAGFGSRGLVKGRGGEGETPPPPKGLKPGRGGVGETMGRSLLATSSN